MQRYRVSYSFTDTFQGDEDAIAKAVRDLSFASTFQPHDINDWKVKTSIMGAGFILEAKRTVVDEIFEESPKAALRKFLYGHDVPPNFDPRLVKVEQLGEPVVLHEVVEAAE